MKHDMMLARSSLRKLLEAHDLTAGMYVRAHGKNLIVGREEQVGSEGAIQRDDRVRLTRLSASKYGLSVKRHTGRWERTPFAGTMGEMVEAITTYMQHLVAAYS